jgi:hypothetical protein
LVYGTGFVNTIRIKFSMKIILRSFWPAIASLIVSSVLFFIPGSALPERDWFAKIELDKIVHVVLFAILVVLWCIPFFYKPSLTIRLPKVLIFIPFIFFGYSIIVEFIQDFFIPGRSFDLVDILADALGCAFGFLFVKQYQRFFTNVK